MDLMTRNNLIYMEFEILGMRQKIIAHKYGLCERWVKRIIHDARKSRNEKWKKLSASTVHPSPSQPGMPEHVAKTNNKSN